MENHFYDWEFLKYMYKLLKEENKCSALAFVDNMIRIKDTYLVTCGNLSNK